MRTQNSFRIVTFATALLLLVSLLMTSCAPGETTSGAESSLLAEDIAYTVTVKDGFGTPWSNGVVAQFMKGDEKIAMQPCDANGVATKMLPAGEYTVTLGFSDSSNAFHYESVILNAENSSAEILLYQAVSGEADVLTIETTDHDIYPVENGTTYLKLAAGARNYFLYTPSQAGNYEFCILSGDVTFGYYGAPHYVMETPAVEVENNRFTISIRASMIGTGDGGTSSFVLGVDPAEETESCVIGIRRIGDPIKTIEDEPWIIYKATTEPEAYQLPESTKLVDFDFTKEYTLVLNDTDGYYHLNSADGPLVLMRLTEDSEYMDCYKTILEHTGVTKYFYDADGNFDKKENYGECLLSYIECADPVSGTYPLTEDLKYIVQQHGDYQGWWDPESRAYLFVDLNGNPEPDINHEIAWLLMCCYAE
jgi:hypothetical protein